MSDEEVVPLVNDEETSAEDDLGSEGKYTIKCSNDVNYDYRTHVSYIAVPIAPPPDYESSLQPITSPAPPYPGTDIELPDYCDVVVTSPTTTNLVCNLRPQVKYYMLF